MFVTLRSQMIMDMNDALLDANPNAFLYGTLLMGGVKKVLAFLPVLFFLFVLLSLSFRYFLLTW